MHWVLTQWWWVNKYRFIDICTEKGTWHFPFHLYKVKDGELQMWDWLRNHYVKQIQMGFFISGGLRAFNIFQKAEQSIFFKVIWSWIPFSFFFLTHTPFLNYNNRVWKAESWNINDNIKSLHLYGTPEFTPCFHVHCYYHLQRRMQELRETVISGLPEKKQLQRPEWG